MVVARQDTNIKEKCLAVQTTIDVCLVAGPSGKEDKQKEQGGGDAKKQLYYLVQSAQMALL